MTYLRGRTVLLGLLFGVISIGTAQAASATRTSAFEYDAATGLLAKEIVEPDNAPLRLETAYTYDAYGNKTVATVSSPATGTAAITARSSSTGYDTSGQFPISSTNTVGQSETKVFDPKFGNLTSLTGPNGLTTQWQYDSFGRKVREIRADGNQTRLDYLYCGNYNGGSAPCVSLARYLVQATPLAADGVTANGAWSKTYFDALDREVRSETQGFDGSVIIKDTEYDSLGRVARISLPYYNGQTPLWSSSTYDAIGRMVAATQPDNSQSTSYYNGLTTSATNALSQTQTKIQNSQGQLVQVIDAQNNSITYQYDPFGNLTKTTDPLGNNTTLVYDQRGRKVQMIDPGMGTWNYDYNVLGQLIKQTDAKNQVTTIAYDLLGRMTSRAEPDLVSNWTFDNCTKGIGKPCTATTDNGYSRSHSYDSLGRPVSTATTIDTGYSNAATFDANGRIAIQTYPTGLAVKYLYTSLGYLKEVRNNATNALYWQADTMDAQGHLLQQTYGNGVITQQVYETATGRLKNIYAGAGNGVQNLAYSYDSIGNQLSRNDATQSLSETFLYDALNRLTTATVNSGAAGLVTQSFAYNAIGNITSRSDVGTYSYGATNNRPHAVTEVQLAGGGKRQYTYDANGALTQEVQLDAANNVIASKGRIEVYASFGMPQALGAPGISLAFAYGPEHQRVKQIAPSATTIYLHPDNSGGLSYEKDLKADGATEHKHFITAGGQVIAVVKQTASGTTVSYFHRDQLGSTTAMTNEAGAVIERLAYEAFGKRRFATGITDPDNTIVGVNTDRGYTNHEHLDELGLIHMNGRIYDPVLGRFMSADPNIPYADDLQSFNRYAYVRNNPVNAVDLDGFFDGPIGGGYYAGSDITIYDYYRRKSQTGSLPIGTIGGFNVSIGFPQGSIQRGPQPSSGNPLGSSGSSAPAAPVVPVTVAIVPTPIPKPTPIAPVYQNFMSGWSGNRSVMDMSSAWVTTGSMARQIADGLYNTAAYTLIGIDVLNTAVPGLQGPDVGLIGAAMLGTKGTANAYSVAFETTIAKAGIGTRASHFTDANKSLAAAMKSDSGFAKSMESLSVQVPARLGQSPAGWSWHHVPNQPGVMQLVPRSQHQGGPWQPLLHPDRVGGFKLWGNNY